MPYHILVVDDDILMRRSTSLQLEQAGYRASTAASAEDALALTRRDRPDLILLDIGLPGMDGLQALASFKQLTAAPVIFVSARRRELDTILGLELGADDYITKPFNPDVLLARVKAVLRRGGAAAAGSSEAAPCLVGDIVIDAAAHTVTVAGRPVDLTVREFGVLYALALEAGKVLSIDDLIARVWGAEYAGEPQVVYVQIRWLREKIEDDPNKPSRILNMRGVGYKLAPRES
jgi:DNA-binding response OmpR family regulator